MATFTNIVAAKKLASIKKNYKLTEKSERQNSPEAQRKLEKKIEKDVRKREKETQKREDLHEKRTIEREKFRSQIRDKYQIGGESKDATSVKKSKKELKEKDFHKYNKSVNKEKGKDTRFKKVEDTGRTSTFSRTTNQLAGKDKDKSDCVIS